MSASNRVREQYERFPYPAVPTLALPRRGQGDALLFELGSGRSSAGIRILVAGAGTLEAIVVAQAHPDAAAVVAVDVSTASLRRLARRAALARLSRWHAKAPRIDMHVADLFEWEPAEPFHYIVATNVLQHTEDPSLLLWRLSQWLLPGGWLRLVTYPATSRLWIRHTSRWLRLQGLGPHTAHLVDEVRCRVGELEPADPIRQTVALHGDARTAAGLVDAFFHACERPMTPLAWATASHAAGLRLVHEGQAADSQSSMLCRLFPASETLSSWERLQVVDDLLELCDNPVLWFTREQACAGQPADVRPQLYGESVDAWRDELGTAVFRAGTLLDRVGLRLPDVIDSIAAEFGPRMRGEVLYPGLTVAELPWQEIMSAAMSPG